MSAVAYHWSLFRRALADDRAEARDRKESLEPRFLPAALEVIERPVSPTGRRTAWAMLGCLAATSAWLVLGQVDVVATADGKIAPVGNVKLVQAATAGIVRNIHVHDGDRVKAGQVLVDLDSTVSGAEESQAARALLAAEIDVARGTAIVEGLSGGAGHFVAPAGTPADVADTQRRLVAAQLASIRAEGAGLAAARSAALSEAAAARDQVRTYDANRPLMDKHLAAITSLADKGYASGLRLLEVQRQRRSEAGSRDVAASQVARGNSEARRFAQQLSQSREAARQSALTDLARAQAEAMMRREELTKARDRSRMQQLRAPVDGTVQQLAVHTIGGVVEPVRPLMVVVPDDALVMEARVLNRDAGFVRAGQKVSVKLEAFPFTRFGTVPGRILTISRDAVQDEKTPPYYVARIALDQRSIEADGRRVPLTPGLSATADVRIGERRIIRYLFDPMDTGIREAGRER